MSRRMTKWATDAGRGLGVGIGLIAFITVVDLLLLWLAAELAPRVGSLTWIASGGTFVACLALLFSLAPLGLIVYWLYGLTHSVYLLDRNELIIRWGTTEQIVPVGQIELVLTGDEIAEQVKFRGGGWPGHYVGYGEVPIPDAGLTPALFYATAPPQDQIYVVTPGLVYGISPADHEDFLESLRERMQMGPTQVVEQSSRRPGFLGWEIWQDRFGMALLAGSSLALLVLVGLLIFKFPSLKPLIPLHFDAAGNADRLGPRIQVFTTPLIGLLTLLLNGLLGGVAYRRERMISYLLWGGAALVQMLVWVATLRLLGRM
jgi:hypothetical protein